MHRSGVVHIRDAVSRKNLKIFEHYLHQSTIISENFNNFDVYCGLIVLDILHQIFLKKFNFIFLFLISYNKKIKYICFCLITFFNFSIFESNLIVSKYLDRAFSENLYSFTNNAKIIKT